MIRTVPEGQDLKLGLNFYPWSERRYSIGVRIVWKWGDTDYCYKIRYRPERKSHFFKVIPRALITGLVKVTPADKQRWEDFHNANV